jgi:hypothetical protein
MDAHSLPTQLLWCVTLLFNCQRTDSLKLSGFSYLKNSQKLTSYCFFYIPSSHIISDGGGERDRTDDLLRARQALSQLSYTPTVLYHQASVPEWWAWGDLNLRPHAYQACALTG